MYKNTHPNAPMTEQPSMIGREAVMPEQAENSLGDILRRTKGLTAEQVKDALDYQNLNGVRFGEAVVALGLATSQDIVWALAQQFHYPYTPTSEGELHAELVVANTPFSEQVESFRELRTQMLSGPMGHGDDRKALSIVSSDVGDGKSFVAANLAVAFSQLPGRTLLVDADLRNPRLHEIFGVDVSSGLSGILSGRAAANVIKPVKHLPNLYMLPAGVMPPNPAELLHRAAFSLLIKELLGKFDYLLVDTPAASLGPDARMIAAHCGACLLVGRSGRTRVDNMQQFVKQLKKSTVRVGGVLMNDH
ncbi:polysaccharide biosynthesis tyrosine autokinase [Aquabacterium lacunae]|jgi:protein-tyrosine kinase|uniref:Polysaccharide biosynthesis tyrosine autokinase n=1 Tax=Aquabacterium lacunae TaxID=2528630 RepID=A0A4Q9GX59_9BURK|nr:polysaccharide biosynthesis tyrosine autokinase [Aquabacterium lacunae]TBO30183.1 polysaccharide biosynthesis tyrosine autokinase [Aquabacterium lacunae]